MTETSMLSRTLSPPESWIDELCAIRAPDAGTGEFEVPEVVVLSYAPRRVAEWDVDLEDVKTDLGQGSWIRRGAPHPGGERYWLIGSCYEAEILSKLADGRPWTIALVLRMTRLPDNAVPPRAGQLTCAVEFVEVRHEERCDVGEMYREIQRAEHYQRARQTVNRAIHQARREPELVRRAELHKEASKRYGILRLLLSLLAQRAERSARNGSGVIVPSPDEGMSSEDSFLYVRIGQHDGSLRDFDDAYIKLCGTQHDARTRVHAVVGNVLVLNMPRSGEWLIDDLVTVTTVPRFAMKQHDIALSRFLREEIEGNWDDLAALLCRPVALDMQSRPTPPWFYCDQDPHEDPLNDKQRKAVAGALATPHAFAIQGPPGTGKTTVICEVVRQLVGRGERVLLLAPQHVAVDEVLSRVGDKPGIRALRLAWDEGRVSEELRRFLPDRAGGEFTAALRRPGPDSDTRWEARRVRLLAEQTAVNRLLNAQASADRVTTALAVAENAALEATRGLDEARAWHAREIEKRINELAAARAELESATAATDRAAEAVAEARAQFEAVRSPVEHLLTALDILARMEEELSTARTADLDAQSELAQWQQLWTARSQRASAALGAIEQPYIAATRAANEALGRLQAASADLSTLPHRRGAWGRLVDRLGFGVMARRHAETEEARVWWMRCDQEWRRWDTQRRQWIEERHRLETEGRAEGHRRADRATESRIRREAAEQARNRASGRWREVTDNEIGAPWVSEPEDAGRRADTVRIVLSEPDTTAPLRPSLASWEFRQAHDQLRAAVASHRQRIADQQAATERVIAVQRSLDGAATGNRAEEIRLTEMAAAATGAMADRRVELRQADHELTEAATALGYTDAPDRPELQTRRDRLERQVRVLPSDPTLRRRWLELVGNLNDQELAHDIGDALVRSVNLVCATTTGIDGRAAESVRRMDFDSLIVDEASRVIDSEFLIGAIRARRWILVGDEHQLPPYVDQGDEQHLHALAALYRHDRGEAGSLEDSVRHLAMLWRKDEDEEQRQFRTDAVIDVAEQLRASGDWPAVYQETFVEAHRRFDGSDPDRELLETMRAHLVRSLFERVVKDCRRSLREQLVVQRRMIAPIAEIVRGPIYGYKYDSPPPADLRRCGVYPLTTEDFERPVVFLDTSLRGAECQVGHGFINKLEAEWIEKACRYYEQGLPGDDEVTVSILCFYLAQAHLMRERLKAPRYPGFRRLTFKRIDPIDKIQGQQSDIVFISFTRHNSNPGLNFGQWLQDLRRLNVACTRARRALVLVGNWDMLGKLRTFDKAKGFYTNLLDLFDSSEHFMRSRDFS